MISTLMLVLSLVFADAKEVSDRAKVDGSTPVGSQQLCENPEQLKRKPPPDPSSLGPPCRSLRFLENYFVSQHILLPQKGDGHFKRVVEKWLEIVDPSKVFLTETDVESVKAKLQKVYFADGDHPEATMCSLLSGIGDLVRLRTEERIRFGLQFLKNEYKPVSVKFPEQPPKTFPKNEAEANERQKEIIHASLTARVSAGYSKEKAQQRALQNWERMQDSNDMPNEVFYSAYVRAFAQGFDPHSDYTPPGEEPAFFMTQKKVNGIGVQMMFQDTEPEVVDVLPGGAAAKSGQIRPGDKVIGVAQGNCPFIDTNRLDQNEILSRILGEKGTTVRLLLLRKTTSNSDPVKSTPAKEEQVIVDGLVRDEIKHNAGAKISYREQVVDGKVRKIGRIFVPTFYGGEGASSSADVRRLILEAKSKKVDGLVLDLSGNPGGLLDESIKMSGLFVEKGRIVGERRAREALVYMDPAAMLEWDGPLVVRTDFGSASASEIVAGALQGYGRAVVVGNERTFGKGSVQDARFIGDPDTRKPIGMVKVTQALYYLPTGKSPQRQGVFSDVVIEAGSKPFRSESDLPLALRAGHGNPFLSESSQTGEGKWTKVSTEWKTWLSRRSLERQRANTKKSAEVHQEAENVLFDLIELQKVLEQQKQPMS